MAVAAYVGSGYLPGGFSYVAGTVVPLALLIPAVATTDLRGSRSPLRWRAIVWLGEISFAFYLVHQLAIRFVQHGLGSRTWPAAEGLLLAAAMLALALASAAALYHFVERPMMTRLAGSNDRPAMVDIRRDRDVRRTIDRAVRPTGTWPIGHRSARRRPGRRRVPEPLATAATLGDPGTSDRVSGV
jgi:peptidoglycan/LPS O-acetylase OafA/YrhL